MISCNLIGLHERAAFYDILARGPKELFFSKTSQGVKLIVELA